MMYTVFPFQRMEVMTTLSWKTFSHIVCSFSGLFSFVGVSL